MEKQGFDCCEQELLPHCASHAYMLRFSERITMYVALRIRCEYVRCRNKPPMNGAISSCQHESHGLIMSNILQELRFRNLKCGSEFFFSNSGSTTNHDPKIQIMLIILLFFPSAIQDFGLKSGSLFQSFSRRQEKR